MYNTLIVFYRVKNLNAKFLINILKTAKIGVKPIFLGYEPNGLPPVSFTIKWFE